MHFLSHYYVERPANSPLFVAALGIPDLVPGFSKTYNLFVKNSVLQGNGELKQVETGILHHYQADKWFHNSPAFLQHIAMIIQSFIKEGLDRNRLRLSVIAHVAVELMIDRQIVLEHEDICTEFYNQIDKADEGAIGTFFDHFGLVKQKEEYFTRLRFFKQRKFLFLFNDMENIIYGLDRVYNSVTKTVFTEDEKLKFLSSLNNIDLVMRYSWNEILKA